MTPAAKEPIIILAAAAGGRRRLVYHLPDPPLAPDGQPLLPGPHDDSSGRWSPTRLVCFVVLFISALIIMFLLRRSCRRTDEEEERHQEPGRRGERRLQRPRPSGGGSGGGDGRRRHRAPPRQEQQHQESSLAAVKRQAVVECTYQAAEPWDEGTCSVCLAELADGEAVRVLPACMHYFHAGCVEEWLRKSATCPLCRAPLIKVATRSANL